MQNSCKKECKGGEMLLGFGSALKYAAAPRLEPKVILPT